MKKDNQQLVDLKLIDEVTNMQYIIKVEKEVYNRAHNDMLFATKLLQEARLLVNSKSSHNSALPINVVNDINEPSCSNITNICNKNITNTVVPDDTIQNTLHGNNYDTEDISDTLDIGSREKWEHNAILLLISLYKEKANMLGKSSHKKIWTEISQCIKQKKIQVYSQCNNKMDALKRQYRKVIDRNAQSGNDRKEWIYLEVLDDIFRKKHGVKPLAVAGSNIKEPEHSPLDNSDNENEPPVKRRISLSEARANYLKVSLEEKKIKREETANYRAQKLQILKEIKKAFENQK